MEPQGFDDEEPEDLTRVRWERAQRDLITTVLDYNLQTVASLVTDQRINLNPAYQRRDRWDVTRKSRLIESFLMNVPLPPVFLNEDDYGSYSIIDGKQRITAVYEFLTDRFKLEGLTVFQEANGKHFSELDRELQSVLQTRASLRAIILLRLSDPQIKYHVFQRLNTGGIRLNAQEVRNVSFFGELNDALIEIAQNEAYQRSLGIDPKSPSKSALWNQMRDVELVLRYFTLRDDWQGFTGSLVGAMNFWMAEHFTATHEERSTLALDFESNLENALAAFGPFTFRRVTSSGGPGNARLATLFDAEMIGTAGYDVALLKQHSASLQRELVLLFEHTEFQKAIGAQTNTPALVRKRIELVADLVHRVTGA